jgi:phage terminase small subunit
MSRRSNASMISPFPAIDAGRTRLSPPSNLSKTEQQIFRGIVSSVPPKHFIKSDIVLLTRYVQDIALADIAAANLKKDGSVDATGKLSPWLRALEKLDRSIIALATKLRLAPSARFDSRAADRNARAPEPSVYDLMNQFDDEEDAEHVDVGRN